MPNSKIARHRKGRNDIREKLMEKSSSFHGWPEAAVVAELRRPNTFPDLLARNVTVLVEGRARLTKLLLNVTIHGSLGPVQVILIPKSTVGDLIAAAVRHYVKEGRRPILPSTEPGAFDLHYSQFSLESLDREQKIIELGSRNFFLCPRRLFEAGEMIAPSSSCSEQVEKACKKSVPWLKFMSFLL